MGTKLVVFFYIKEINLWAGFISLQYFEESPFCCSERSERMTKTLTVKVV